MHKGLIFFIFIAAEIFKTFLNKRHLLDTTMLLISRFFIEMSPLCW